MKRLLLYHGSLLSVHTVGHLRTDEGDLNFPPLCRARSWGEIVR